MLHAQRGTVTRPCITTKRVIWPKPTMPVVGPRPRRCSKRSKRKVWRDRELTGCADAWFTQVALWGSSAPPARMGWRYTSRCRCAARLRYLRRGCFFDQGVTTFWRRGVAYGSPMEIVPAGFPRGACRRPHVALDAVRVFERIAVMSRCWDWLPWAPTRAAADPGWPHLSEIWTRDETASGNGLLPPCW
jgi:hypothetical protein